MEARNSSSDLGAEVSRELNGEVFTEKRQLGGGRAFGILSVCILSLCTVVLYGRMYRDLVQHQEELLAASERVFSGHSATLEAKRAAKEEAQGKLRKDKTSSDGEDRWRNVDLTLHQAVENVAGANRSIIFVSASKDYLDFLENWYKSVARFGHGERVLFIAEDDLAYDYLKKKWPAQTVLVRSSDFQLGINDSGDGDNSTYGSSHYNSLVDRRPEYFKALIDLNVTFLYNDVDIVWLKDPYPFFNGHFDMWVQEDAIMFEGSLDRFKGGAPALPIRDKRHAICTCFMMVRPTRASRFLVHRWSRHVRTQVAHGGKAVLNQPAFNKALSLTPDSQVLVGVLPVQFFPSGYIFFRCSGQPYCRKNWQERERFWAAVKEAQSWPATVHNNWLEGHAKKLERFKEYKLWYLDQKD